MYRFRVFATALLLAVVYVGVAAPAYAVDVQHIHIGRQEVRLPAPEQSAPACVESVAFKRLMASSLPPDNQLLTCWVGAKAWADVMAGRSESPYPIVALTYAKSVGDSATLADFENSKRATLKQLPSLLKQGESTEQLGQLNQRRAKDGVPLSVQAGRVQNEGVFDVRPDSYSYVVLRETQIVVAGKPSKAQEAMAVTLLFHRGTVLMLAVVEWGATAETMLSARQRSMAWLAQFRAANPG